MRHLLPKFLITFVLRLGSELFALLYLFFKNIARLEHRVHQKRAAQGTPQQINVCVLLFVPSNLYGPGLTLGRLCLDSQVCSVNLMLVPEAPITFDVAALLFPS
jgi:hypothetical protein